MAKRTKTTPPEPPAITKLGDHPGFARAKTERQELAAKLLEVEHDLAEAEAEQELSRDAGGSDVAVMVEAEVELETKILALRRTKAAVQRSLQAATKKVDEQKALARRSMQQAVRPEYERMVREYVASIDKAVELHRAILKFWSDNSQLGLELPVAIFPLLKGQTPESIDAWKTTLRQQGLIQ